ncbi:MAG TPA: type II toxin-antitoxin system death-on-curing family toxin [Thermoanaerobaculia bacterium]|nr:type II toxin-antitoxin system death-on-curing family toxin [Thermoanaerobaculia bacterium]
MNPLFLALDEVLGLHAEQIRLFGGSSGIRDVGLLQPAMGSVEATFGGAFLHETIFAMAAAYLYGICRSHPFIDGNKRTAVGAALTFLEMNGVEVDADEDAFYDLVIRVAEGRVSKASVTVFLEDHAR